MTVLLLYFSEDERNTADLEETERRNLLIGKECLKIKWDSCSGFLHTKERKG